MDELREPLEATPQPLMPQRPSFLVRAAIYTLVPILIVVALPLLFLIILVIYLLAVIQGGRVFVYSGTVAKEEPEHDLPKPHFLEMPEPAKALPDESHPPTP